MIINPYKLEGEIDGKQEYKVDGIAHINMGVYDGKIRVKSLDKINYTPYKPSDGTLDFD